MQWLWFFVAIWTLAVARECPRGRREPAPYCSSSANPTFRPIDGRLNKPCTNSGKSFAPFERLQNPHYDDCDREIRRAKSGRELPQVRTIVNRVLRAFRRDVTRVKKVPNLMSAFIGQYIAHDLAMRNDDVPDNVTINCCTAEGWPIEGRSRHPSCIAIEIPNNDPDYGRSNPDFHCMGMYRSKLLAAGRSQGPGEQLNQVTAFLDNSNLYGSEQSVCDGLQARAGGELKTDSEDILPKKGDKYYLGDIRVTQTPQLMLLHSVWLREHNRIARILRNMNRHWNNRRLFEETRRIVIAQYQHMVYEEFLPAYIDRSIMDHVENAPFSPKTLPVSYNEFGSSVFRILHSFLPTNIKLVDQYEDVQMYKLQDIINDDHLIQTKYDDIARGLLVQPVKIGSFDPGLFHDLHLFSNDSGPGIDLISVDINRGRDHGLPPYVNFLKEFKGAPVRSFNDLHPYISRDNIRLLQQTYESVEDIDLLVGTTLEVPMDGYLMGPTAQMMFYQQFKNLRAADPYFYNNPHNPYPFGKRQLLEIFKASANQLICANTDVGWVPRHPMRTTQTGDMVPCNSLPKMSYEAWREN